MKHTIRACLFILITAIPAVSSACHNHELEEYRYGHYMADALLVRPVGLLATIAGAGLYVATLPFSVLDDDWQAFDTFVVNPYEATFTRCLGCRLGYDERQEFNACYDHINQQQELITTNGLPTRAADS